MRFPDAEVTTLDLVRHGEPVGAGCCAAPPTTP